MPEESSTSVRRRWSRWRGRVPLPEVQRLSARSTVWLAIMVLAVVAEAPAEFYLAMMALPPGPPAPDQEAVPA